MEHRGPTLPGITAAFIALVERCLVIALDYGVSAGAVVVETA